MARVAAFVDGFNVYHSIADKPCLVPAKWLNYRAFIEAFVRPPDILAHVLLFTAYTFWDSAKESRHRIFVGANEAVGVQVMLGRFKMQDRRCRACKTVLPTPTEKMTDVNIASWLFRMACTDEYDKALIVSGDSDLVPAVEAVKACFPQKRIGVVFPFGRYCKDLQDACHFALRLKNKHFLHHQLPDTVTTASGVTYSRPEEWR